MEVELTDQEQRHQSTPGAQGRKPGFLTAKPEPGSLAHLLLEVAKSTIGLEHLAYPTSETDITWPNLGLRVWASAPFVLAGREHVRLHVQTILLDQIAADPAEVLTLVAEFNSEAFLAPIIFKTDDRALLFHASLLTSVDAQPFAVALLPDLILSQLLDGCDVGGMFHDMLGGGRRQVNGSSEFQALVYADRNSRSQWVRTSAYLSNKNEHAFARLPQELQSCSNWLISQSFNSTIEEGCLVACVPFADALQATLTIKPLVSRDYQTPRVAFLLSVQAAGPLQSIAGYTTVLNAFEQTNAFPTHGIGAWGAYRVSGMHELGLQARVHTSCLHSGVMMHLVQSLCTRVKALSHFLILKDGHLKLDMLR